MVEVEAQGDLALAQGVFGVRYFLIDLPFGLEDGFRQGLDSFKELNGGGLTWSSSWRVQLSTCCRNVRKLIYL